MPIFYGDFQIPRPVQSGSISVEPRTTGDGRIVGRSVIAVVNGTILPDMLDGVATPTAVESKMTAILAKQKAIREALAVPGKIFQIQGWDGGVPLRFPAHYTNVTFDDSTNWLTSCPFRITFEGPLISGEAGSLDYIESCSESWQFQEDEQTWTTHVTHSVSAKGQTTYDGMSGVDKYGWENARSFVVDKLKLGWTEIGDAAWSPKSGLAISADSSTFISSATAWNKIVTDSVDETDGTYSATETFILSESSSWVEEQYQVVISDAEPNYMATVTASGTVHGLFADQGDYAAKYANAKAGMASLLPTLQGKAQAAVGDAFTLGLRPVKSATQSHDLKQGVISYSYEYNDRTLINDAWSFHQVSCSESHEDYKNTVQVGGRVTGVIHPDEDSDPSVRLTRARALWATLKPQIYAWAVQGSGITQLRLFPTHAEVAEEAETGSLTFTYAFDDRETATVEETRTFDQRSSRLDPVTVVSIQGQIKGLRSSSPNSPIAHADRSERFDNALAYWNGIKDNLLGLAEVVFSVADLNPEPVTKAVSFSDKDGSISYNYEFNSTKQPFSQGALSENLTIRENVGVPVVAQHAIPGRAAGPIFQYVGTKTASTLTATVEIVYPIGSPTAKAPPYSVDLDQFKPTATTVYLIEDSSDWQPTTARLMKTRSWIYS